MAKTEPLPASNILPGTAVVIFVLLALTFAPHTSDAQAIVDLTQLGAIVARVPNPGGGGNKNIEVIRDGDKPAVGSTQSSRNFDTYSGADSARPNDWIGYQYAATHTFSRVVFQEGRYFVDGGWFTSLLVQVRNNGTWTEVAGLSSLPAYPGVNDAQSFETYDLSFAPVSGDGIRIFGDPGGSNNFVSVAELEVFGTPAGPATSPVCGDANNDGTITASDGLRILKNSVDPTAFCPPNRCDIDASGSVTATDAFLVLEASVGLPVSMLCPAAAGVVFAVASGGTLGALQLEIDFNLMPGDIVGGGAAVSCQSLVSNATAVFNRIGRILRMSFASTSGFTTPTNLASCDLTAPESAMADHFAISVVDAVDGNGLSAAPFVLAELF